MVSPSFTDSCASPGLSGRRNPLPANAVGGPTRLESLAYDFADKATSRAYPRVT